MHRHRLYLSIKVNYLIGTILASWPANAVERVREA
jgi:hypothetical protein